MNHTRQTVVLLLLLFSISQTFAQGSGKISGVVSDQATGDALPGANVFIEGTSLGSSTGVDGAFQIPKVPAGNYVLVVTYIGYKEQKVDLRVTGEDIVRNVQLEFGAVAGEDVVVTAQAEGQMAAINQQISALSIKNVVSAARIREIPDANAAESVGRLPGVSIVRNEGEGQKVTIRGLSPKYNVMMVSGVRMQSTDRDDRSVDLNMIAPNILSGIEVTKALTADMDADAIGGTVNLTIGKAREGFHSSFSFQDGYASLANEQAYLNYKINGLLSNRFFNGKLGAQLSGFMDKYNRNSDRLTATYDTDEDEIGEDGFVPAFLQQVEIFDRVTDRRRMGGGLVLDYRFSNGSLLMNNFISTLHQDQIEQQNFFTTGYAWRGFAADRELNNTVISNALQGEFDFWGMGIDFSLANSISKQRNPGDLRMDIRTWQETRGLESGAADLINMSPIAFLNAVNVIDRDKIATGTTTLVRDVDETAREAALNLKLPFSLTNYLSGNLKFGGKYVRNTRKNDETQYGIDTDRGGLAGGFNTLLRDSVWTDLGISVEDNGLRAGLFADPTYDFGDFLASNEGISPNIFYNVVSISKMHQMERLAIENGYYLPSPLESSQYDYDYTRNFGAFYAMTELKLGNYVTLLPGIRYEQFSFDYTADSTYVFSRLTAPGEYYYDSKTLNSKVTKDKNWFPQMHLRIKPTDWFDVRLASTKSIIYPDYRAVSPYLFVDTFGTPAVVRLGNPAIKPALTQNYDIYASVYENHIGLFTAGFFYKEIDNLIVPIEYLTRDRSKINNRFPLPTLADSEVHTWTNLEETSEVKGIELDWQTNFWYLPSFLKSLIFNINYTHIKSETYYPRFFLRRIGTFPNFRTVAVDTVRSGRLVDQPDDILNLTLGYDIGGFSARLSFLYQDNVFRQAHITYQELDSYTAAYYRWDFTAYQKLPWYHGRLQLFLNINNISNRPDREFTSVLEKLSLVSYYGRTADLGFRYTF